MKKRILTILLVCVGLFMVVGCEDSGTGTTGKYEYTTPETDKLQLIQDYTNKNFIKDGIGQVTVAQYVDGDTTIFKDDSGQHFTVRYQGVNTPESTYKIEPWGFAASKYTKSVLKQAKTIVLQAEPNQDRFDSTGRYLAWVWVDGRLLNLELVELAYAQAKASDTMYMEPFNRAVMPLIKNKVRIYGETDPDYDYSQAGKESTIKEILETYGTKDAVTNKTGLGKKVVVVGTIVRQNGNASAYLQQYDAESDTYYGIYLFGGYSAMSKFAVGNTVILEGKIGYYFGAIQIADFTSSSIKVKSFAPSSEEEINNLINIKSVHPEDYNENNYHLFGSLIKLQNLTVTGYSDADNTNAFTINTTYVNDKGQTVRMDIRVDQNITLKDEFGDRITSGKYFVGKTFASIIGIAGYYDPSDDGTYNGRVQLLLTRMNDFVLA